MAVFTATTWVDDTEQTVSASACRVKCIEVFPNEAQANEVYLQIWDVVDPDPGTTAPMMVLRIPTADSQGNATVGTWTTSGGSSRKMKIVFSGYGLVFTTACTILCTTTVSGQTAATTTSLPKLVRVYYQPHA
mgnify:CR=1 FL=1